MIELAVAIVAALYTAGLAVREAERAVSPRVRAVEPVPRGAEPPAEAVPVETTPVEAPVPRRGDEIAPASPRSATGQAEPVGVPIVRPDPGRLIQTEVIVPTEEAERPVAYVKLAAGIAALGALFAFGAIGLVRGIELLLRKLSGG